MKYLFLKFSFDTITNELSSGKKIIVLTKQHKDLLRYYLENPNRIISKDDLIDNVWKGRVVTSNTIDQSISKLKKILSEVKEDEYFETVYGQGIKFCPKITFKDTETSKSKLPLFVIALVIISFVAYYIQSQTRNETKLDKPIVLLLTKQQDNKQWFDDSSRIFIEQLMTFSNSAWLKNIDDKPGNLNIQQFIDKQLQISPNTNTVTTEIIEKDNSYTFIVTIIDSDQQSKTQSFTHKNIAKTLEQGSHWLQTELNYNLDNNKVIASLTPENPYLVESYLRGLDNMNSGEIDKASHYFELCIGEKPDFHLARLALAKIKNKQGKLPESLELLDTLSQLESNPMLQITIETLKGDIYDTQGKPELARDTYLQILNKYKEYDLSSLNDVRYNLSYSYSVLTEYQLALDQLDVISANLTIEQNAALLANVYQKKGSIYQKLGNIDLARENATQSLNMFIQIDELIGAAKVRSLLARIASHEANYAEAQVQLEHALSITRSLNYKLGTGATLNELIYVLMVQSQHKKAWELNQEMEQIATEIDYKAMVIASKQFAIDMSIKQKKWSVAQTYLQQHKQLAIETKNQRALIKNKLLTLDFILDQNKIEDNEGNSVKLLLDELQDHINESQEIRLQPRINQNLARWYFLNAQDDEALKLLIASKQLSQETQDGESTIDINNLLANYYLDKNAPQKALDILEESTQLKPTNYPYLLFKSKANEQLGNTADAIKLAKSCKQQAIDLWTQEDEKYLNLLLKNSI